MRDLPQAWARKQVGRSTTSAVVKSIFLVIAVDLVFTASFISRRLDNYEEMCRWNMAKRECPGERPSISVRDLRVNYGDREILHGISFEVPRGETLVILGGSGSGKSTLLRTLVGLEQPSGGEIWIREGISRRCPSPSATSCARKWACRFRAARSLAR